MRTLPWSWGDLPVTSSRVMSRGIQRFCSSMVSADRHRHSSRQPLEGAKEHATGFIPGKLCNFADCMALPFIGYNKMQIIQLWHNFYVTNNLIHVKLLWVPQISVSNASFIRPVNSPTLKRRFKAFHVKFHIHNKTTDLFVSRICNLLLSACLITWLQLSIFIVTLLISAS